MASQRLLSESEQHSISEFLNCMAAGQGSRGIEMLQGSHQQRECLYAASGEQGFGPGSGEGPVGISEQGLFPQPGPVMEAPPDLVTMEPTTPDGVCEPSMPLTYSSPAAFTAPKASRGRPEAGAASTAIPTVIGKQPRKRGRKPAGALQARRNPTAITPMGNTRELLSEPQKKANHIASEQKRRQNIRVGLEKIIELVPALAEGPQKSEAVVLGKTCEYVRELLMRRETLKERMGELRAALGRRDASDPGDHEEEEDEEEEADPYSKRIRTYRRSNYVPLRKGPSRD